MEDEKTEPHPKPREWGFRDQDPTQVGIAKKMIIISCLVCASLAFLLWGILRFPRKFQITKNYRNKTCLKDVWICPQGWRQINTNCFFQSEHEATWVNGHENCKTYQASLAKLNNQNEMKSLMQYLNPSSYWIGLNKRNSPTMWKWADESPFENWYTMQKDGDCAFIHKEGINSTNCEDMRKYICSKSSYCP